MKASVIFVSTLLACYEMLSAAPTFELMKDLDVEKFSTTKWWVTHRGERLRQGHLDRCLAISLGRRFKDEKLYIEIDHENSGAIDQAYFPASLDPTGFQFTMDDGEKADIDIVYTDYATFAIGFLTSDKRPNGFLVLYATVPKPEGELLEKMKSKLQEITGVGVDALQIVDNDDCPEKIEKNP